MVLPRQLAQTPRIKRLLNLGSLGWACRGYVDGMGTEPLEVLREVWRSRGQTSADLDEGHAGSCKRMSDAGVGFDDFGGQDGDLSAAWRARLEREGKLSQSGQSVRDLVLGRDPAPAEPQSPSQQR